MSSIDFFCCNTGEIPFYLPIYKHLKNAKMVISETRYDQKRTIEHLERLGIPYQTEPSEDAIAVITTQTKKEPWLHDRWKLLPKIRVLYALCNKGKMYEDGYFKIFDLVLSSGPYIHELASKHTNSVIIGYPKFDKYFKGLIKKEIILKELNLDLDKNKKTILYAPTHDDNLDMSSIPKFYEAIIKLTRNYNIIFKPHVRHDYCENHLIGLFKNGDNDAKVVPVMTDLDKLFAISDFIIGDCQSGLIWEALIANKICIVCFKESKTPFTRLEIPVVEGKVMPIIKEPNKLFGTIKYFESQEGIERWNKTRNEWLEKVCSYNDGESGNRSADAIVNFLKQHKTNERKEGKKWQQIEILKK